MAANSFLTATVMVAFMLVSVADITDCALVNSSILSNSCLMDFHEGLQMLQIYVKFSNPFSKLYCAIDILLQSIHCHLLHTSQLVHRESVARAAVQHTQVVSLSFWFIYREPSV